MMAKRFVKEKFSEIVDRERMYLHDLRIERVVDRVRLETLGVSLLEFMQNLLYEYVDVPLEKIVSHLTE